MVPSASSVWYRRSSTRVKSSATSGASRVSSTMLKAPERRLFARLRSSTVRSCSRASASPSPVGWATSRYVSPGACTDSQRTDTGRSSPSSPRHLAGEEEPSSENGSPATGEPSSAASASPRSGKSSWIWSPATSTSPAPRSSAASSLARSTFPPPSNTRTQSLVSCNSRENVPTRLPSPIPSTWRLASAELDLAMCAATPSRPAARLG